MSNLPSENLEERIERILKKNEEIEKKHREAEEDRLMALKDNAMVEIKAPKDEDWPREHKYDKLDFTYDQKDNTPEEPLDAPKEPDSTNVSSTKVKRDYKKFAEGEGPPPDPMYNFLADAERDGKLLMRAENNKQLNVDSSNVHKKEWKPNLSKGKPGGVGGSGGGGRGGRQGKNNRSNEYDSWKNEREKIDEERISRQKAGEGKWRREWDNEKDNESSNRSNNNGQKYINKNSSNKNGYPDNQNNGNFQQKVHSTDIHVQAPVNLANTFPSNQKNCASNIMVSVSQDANGEVKSVKLTSAPTIGTGRVGPRHVPKTQFQVMNRPENQQFRKSISTDGNRNDRQPPQRSNSLRYEQSTKQPLIKSSIQDRLKPNICQNNNTDALIQSPHNPVFVNN